MEIQHFSNDHPLLPCDGEEDMVCCPVCGLVVLGPAYGCPDSKCDCFVIHKSRVELPREINHPFHRRHPLTLTQAPYDKDSGSFDCDACGWNLSGCFTYHCSRCSFDLDLFCASLMPNAAAATDDHRQSPITHRHSLTICDKNSNFDHPCSGCGRPLENSIHVCLPCKLLLHKSCAELPQKIQHPFHNPHPLTLISISGVALKCRACSRLCSGFTYHCSECNFYMDTLCAFPESPVPTIKSELHHHPLAFINTTHPAFKSLDDPLALLDKKFRCGRCPLPFDAPFFRCLDCEFNLHLSCIPTLPKTIKHDGHTHHLYLSDGPIGDDPDEDEDNYVKIYYCDACEKKRRLFDPCYYCKECPYVAHVDCVESEVIPELAKQVSLGEQRTDKWDSERLLASLALLLPLLPVIRRGIATAHKVIMLFSPLDAIVLLKILLFYKICIEHLSRMMYQRHYYN